MRGTVASPSTRWHWVPLSSVFICEFLLSQTGEKLELHFLYPAPCSSQHPHEDFVSFPQGHLGPEKLWGTEGVWHLLK